VFHEQCHEHRAVRANEEGEVKGVVDYEAVRRRWWTALTLACVAFAYFSAFRSYGINLPDEGTLLYKFERMADGEHLYADFHAGYTPGVFYVHSFLQEYLGQSILPGRVVLGLVSSLSVAMLYLLAAPLCGGVFAATAALLYPAFLPVHPGHFASFNVPYPTWYSVAFFLAGLLAARRYLERPRSGQALLVGLLAGLGFLFKPNVGAFQLAAGMLLVLAALPRRGTVAAVAWWWLTWASVLAGVLAVFGGSPAALDVVTFVIPIAAVALVSARRANTAELARSLAAVALPTALVALGFAAITAAWLGHYARFVPLSQLLEEALFVGSDYASFFYTPHPAVFARTAALMAGFAVFYALPGFLRSRSLAPSRLALVVAAVAIAGMAGIVAGRPMLQGFAFSVMSEVESSWAYAAALAAMWLVLGIALARRTPGEALLAVAAGAPFLYATNYPRTDFMHWAWAAPVAVVAGTALLSALADEWRRGAAPGLARGITLVFLLPLLLLGGIRVGSAIQGIFRYEGIAPSWRASIQLGAHRAPVWMNIGRAESYRDLEVVADEIRELTEPGEKIFTFPALDVVSFLADRGSPLRDSYFFPGWIGHDDEARALEVLRAAPPRFAVVLHDTWSFFEAAPSYYSMFAEFFAREYRHYVQIGRYAILAHKTVDGEVREGAAIALGESDPRLERYLQSRLEPLDVVADPAGRVRDLRYDSIEGYYPDLVALLDYQDESVRGAAVDALRSATDDRVAAALFRAAIAGRLPERERLLALRLAGVWTRDETVALMQPRVADKDADVASAARAGLECYEIERAREAAWFGRRKSSVADTRSP
jgi:hypothetical protein